MRSMNPKQFQGDLRQYNRGFLVPCSNCDVSSFGKQRVKESVQPGFRMYEVHTKSRESSHETVQVTNYRFQKSMNPDWEIQPSLLYQAYAPASATSIASVAGAALASSVDGHGLRFPLWHVTSSTAGHEGWWVPSSKTSSHQKSSLTRCPRWCRQSIV